MVKKKSARTPRARTVGKMNDAIEFKKSGIHGMGGFALRNIRKGEAIIEYVGEKITKKEAVARLEGDNRYIFTLNKKNDVDGSVDWNPARFINHSCAPNAGVKINRNRIWIVALRTI